MAEPMQANAWWWNEVLTTLEDVLGQMNYTQRQTDGYKKAAHTLHVAKTLSASALVLTGYVKAADLRQVVEAFEDRVMSLGRIPDFIDKLWVLLSAAGKQEPVMPVRVVLAMIDDEDVNGNVSVAVRLRRKLIPYCPIPLREETESEKAIRGLLEQRRQSEVEDKVCIDMLMKDIEALSEFDPGKEPVNVNVDVSVDVPVIPFSVIDRLEKHLEQYMEKVMDDLQDRLGKNGVRFLSVVEKRINRNRGCYDVFLLDSANSFCLYSRSTRYLYERCG